MGGSKSSSSNQTTTVTTQEDNRVAGTDNAIVAGKGATIDLSTDVGGGISIIEQNANGAAELAAFAEVASREAGETSREAIKSNREVSLKGLGLAGDVSDDAFDFADKNTEQVIGALIGAGELIDETGDQSREQGFGFARDVLAGYEDARLNETERNFERITQGLMVVGVVGIAAWAFVKGK